MPDLDPSVQEVKEAMTALQEEVTKALPNPEVIEKINTTLDAQETKNQELVNSLKTAEESAAEMKERVDVLEAELARAGGPGDEKNFRESPEYKTLHGLIMDGGITLEADLKQLLRTDSDTDGGYLVMGEMDNMITKKITEISNIRSIARVRSIGRKSLEVPIRQAILAATYEGEGEQDELDTSKYGSETLTAFRQSVTVPITKDMLMDASFDMEAEIFGDASEAFAQGEGRNFVLGDGVKKPFGYLADTRVTDNARPTGTAGTVDADDVILLTGDLKVGYNPTYVMNRRTLAFLRTLKSTTGSFLWQPGLNGPVMNTINGFPYILADDMPDIANNAFPIAFGDFMRGYTIVDRTGVSIVRDEFTRKREAIVEFTINRWNTGQVTLPEALKVLQVSV